MKHRVYAIILALLPLLASSQTVPFPSSQGRDFNAVEPYGYQQKGTTWDTSPYLPFIYQGIWFRMMLPNGVTYNSSTKTFSYADPTKKYPLLLFFHGRGEVGTDNNAQLVHGGDVAKAAVLNDQFPAFLLYPQSVGNQGGKQILDKLMTMLPIDVERIYVHGLSNGGAETWKFMLNYPKVAAAAFPMSAADAGAETETQLYTGFRQSQGGLDTNPTPNSSQPIVQWFADNGGHLEYFYLPNNGHNTWDAMYAKPDFFSWFLAHKKNQPLVRFDGNLLCPGSTTNVIIGFTPGFDGYEWRKDGVLMSGQTAYKITTNVFGSYTGRIKRGTVWSAWSDPVAIATKPASVTPAIALAAPHSVYIPDVNSNSTINLTLPAGYATYKWNKVGTTAAIGTTQSISVSAVGSYNATITETNGCPTVPSTPSPNFVVINANGSNKPSPATNLQALGLSLTSIRLTWEQNPTPTVNEIGFEVYRSTASAGPYALIATTGADVVTYQDNNLAQNTYFYYKVRAISASAAAAATGAATALTQVDVTPPTPPNNLARTSVTTTSLKITWSASTDNIAVVAYDVYQREFPSSNWVLAFTTASNVLSQSFFQIPAGKYFNYMVKARDAAGNRSDQSAETFFSSLPALPATGIAYSQYVGTGWTGLPNFASLTPVSTGFMTNFAITPRTQNDNFAFVYTGAISIGTAADYTFFSSSNEGSRLWVNNVLVVDNNHVTNTTIEKSGVITLAPGYYPIRVEYFDKTGTEALTVRWQCAALGIAKAAIPNAILFRDYASVSGLTPLPLAPAIPAGLALTPTSYNSIQLNWTPYAGTGTRIEVYISTNGTTFNLVTSVPATTSTFASVGLTANTRYYYRLKAANILSTSAVTSTVNATTLALPAIPAAPTNLVITGITPTSATLDWTDNATNEDGYEVYKSAFDNASYSKLLSLPANSTHQVDNAVFAHTTYYFKVLAKNVGGNSAFSNEVQIQTTNTSPVISPVANLVMRHDDTNTIQLTAVDADGDLIIIGSNNLPAFASLSDNGNGTADIFLAPTGTDVGTFAGLQVFAKDLFGGIQTITFDITVNDNHTPTLTDPGAVSVNESYTASVNLTGADVDGDLLTWSIQNAPSFMTSNIVNNVATLTFKPGLEDAGSYNVTVSATDPTGGVATRVVPVSVTDFNPNYKVLVNFRNNDDASSVGAAPWNNLTIGGTTLPLNNDSGVASGITITAQGAWTGGNAGMIPGVFPDAVNKSYWFYQSTTTGVHSFKLTGLNPDGKYNLRFLSSRTNSDPTNSRLTVYTVGSESGQQQANGNANNTVDFLGLSPNAAGELTATVTIAVQGTGGQYALVNALVLESFFAGDAAPAAPTSLTAGVVSGQVKLNWTDNAFNELSFDIFRGTDGVSYAKVGSAVSNATSFIDPSVTSGVTYFYQVRAVNGIGVSDFSNAASVVGPNHAPVIQPFASSVSMAELDMQTLRVDAVDADGDALTFTLQGEPSFMWATYVDENSVELTFSPYEGDAGVYTFLLNCDDPSGARSTASVTVTVAAPDEINMKVNFTTATSLAAAPWNNITGLTAGTVLANLKDNNNTATAVSMTLTNGWTTTNPNGYSTGNNTGIYPDAVMRNSYYIDNTPAARTISFSGLNPSKAYDFTFFASRIDATTPAINRTAVYTIGFQSASLDATNNTSNVAKIVGAKAAADGTLSLSIARGSGAAFAFIGGMVIREYVAVVVPTVPSAPQNLASQVLTRTSIKLSWLDTSPDETGFEIWRSIGNNASYSLLTTTAANVSTFTDAGLATAVTHYYKVRAINGTGPSEYTGETNGTTFNFSVSVNFYANTGNQSGWTNLTSIYSDGATVSSNLIDDTGASTGISLVVVKKFDGTNPDGMTTGNNSGIVPDRILTGSWYIDPHSMGIIKFGGLSFLKKYNFSFVASRNGDGDRNTVYTIGTASVTLNASKNISNIVQLKDISPDADGTVTVTVTNTQFALFGYLNGVIIQAIPNNSPGARIAADNADIDQTGSTDENEIMAYPNPFVDRFAVRLGKTQGNVVMSLMSATGAVVLQKEFNWKADSEGMEVQLNDNLAQGIYLLRVVEESGETKVIRLLKQ